MSAVLTLSDVVVEYRQASGVVQAVSGVSLDVAPGETVGIVGESGCGKSTLAKSIVGLVPVASGKINYDGTDLARLSPKERRRRSASLQMIFQDPISSLNPRRTVTDIVMEGASVWPDMVSGDARQRAKELLDQVGLDPNVVGQRHPHQLSGGQCQRVAIARALLLEPKVIVCDEPVSALDVSVQAQILNLLEDLKAQYSLTLVFIAHDLAVVKSISDRVMVMYLGKTCELADASHLYVSPSHPYSEALLRSIPSPDPSTRRQRRQALPGEPPSPIDPPAGCRFHTRCYKAEGVCAATEPALLAVSDQHSVACHFPTSPG